MELLVSAIKGTPLELKCRLFGLNPMQGFRGTLNVDILILFPRLICLKSLIVTHTFGEPGRAEKL